VKPFWTLPTDLRVLPDGSWQVSGLPVVHGSTLRYLKAHLQPEESGAAVVDGAQRMPVQLDGPPFEVRSLVIDSSRGEVRALLDDGSQELVADAAIGMNEETGRFEFAARGGRLRALLSRTAHEVLLAHVEEEGGSFLIAAGRRRISIRT
jgi:hypothetical protein